MRYLLATLTGMVITLCAFAGGVAFAITYLAAEPVAVERPTAASAPVFPSRVVKVDTAQRDRDFERVDSRPMPAALPSEDSMSEPRIDSMTTASLDGSEVQEPAGLQFAALNEPTALNEDHLAWCSERYRSYRPETNSYTSYSGESRACVSPFSDGSAAADDDAIYLEASMAQPARVSVEGPGIDHVEYCFSRYRSYRAEDNTYQPYGGGPRRQCE